MDKIEQTNFSIEVPKQLKDKIEKQAKEIEVSVSDLVKVILFQQFIKH